MMGPGLFPPTFIPLCLEICGGNRRAGEVLPLLPQAAARRSDPGLVLWEGVNLCDFLSSSRTVSPTGQGPSNSKVPCQECLPPGLSLTAPSHFCLKPYPLPHPHPPSNLPPPPYSFSQESQREDQCYTHTTHPRPQSGSGIWGTGAKSVMLRIGILRAHEVRQQGL